MLNASGSYSLALALGGQPLTTPPSTPLTIFPGPCCLSCTLLTSQTPSPQAGQPFRFSFQLLDSFANPCQGSDHGFAPWGFAVGIRGPGGLRSWGTAAPPPSLGQYEGQYTPITAGQYNITVLPLHWLNQVHSICILLLSSAAALPAVHHHGPPYTSHPMRCCCCHLGALTEHCLLHPVQLRLC